jgi:hypothetical protein
MKSLLYVMIFLLLLPLTSVTGQNFTCTVQNQHVSGTDFIFDIYIVRTGSTDLFLGNSDFVLNFNTGNFTSPSFTKVSNGLTGHPYSIAASLIAGSRATLNVQPLGPTDYTEFDSYIEQVSNSAPGTRVATVKLTHITNPSGTAGLQWNTSYTKVAHMNRDDSTVPPFQETNVTSNGTYTNPSDQSLPVAMTSVVASASREQGVVVEWRVESETDCAGFHVLRSAESDGNYRQITDEANMIAGRGNASDAKDYRFVDRNVENGKVYWYKIVEVSTKGKRETYGPISVTALSPVPTEFGFSECYPNPFNPETTVDYKTAEDGNVSVIVYNLMGKQIRTLVTGSKPAGYYKAQWNGRDDRGEAVPTGIYFIRMQSADFSKVRKVMMMK